MDSVNPLSRWKQFGVWCFGLIALSAVILIVLRRGEIERFAELVRQARPAWLLLAMVLQTLTYVCAASVWYVALARAKSPRPLRTLVPLGLAKLFTDQALPSGGISGALLVVQALKRRGVPSATAMGALLVGLVSFYTAYGLAALGGLAVLESHHTVGPAVLIVAGLCASLVVGVPGAVLALRLIPEGPWANWLRRVPGIAPLIKAVGAAPVELIRDPALLIQTTTLQLIVFLLDGSTLYVMLRALSQSSTVWFAFASFMVADVVATVGPIPLGLGVFEGISVITLKMTGVSLEAALAATLLLRGFTFWLPMMPGLWLARRELGN